MRISDCSSDVFSSDLRRRWLGLVASGIPPPLPIIEHRLLLLSDEARRRRALPWAVVTEQQRGAADPTALSRQAVALAHDQPREAGCAVETGRASGRESGGENWWRSVVAGALKKTNKKNP